MKLEKGWSFDYGDICHFQHISRKEAEDKASKTDAYYVVETINWTFANGDSESNRFHHNKYFAQSFKEAYAMATKMEIDFIEVAETIVDIRPATEREIDGYFKAYDYFRKQPSIAMPDDDCYET